MIRDCRRVSDAVTLSLLLVAASGVRMAHMFFASVKIHLNNAFANSHFGFDLILLCRLVFVQQTLG